AHRVFAVALLRVADQAQHARVEIGVAAYVVAHAEVGDVVVERVDREVAAHRIFFEGAVYIVAQDAAVDDVAVARAVVAAAAERGDFDDLVAEHDVREAKAPADQAAIAEKTLDVLGRG